MLPSYRWSSAQAHLGLAKTPTWLDIDQFQRHWSTPAVWRESLMTLTRREVAAIRRATRHDSALGSDDFIQNLELTYRIQLRATPLGRIRKSPGGASARQSSYPNRRFLLSKTRFNHFQMKTAISLFA